MVRSGFFNSVNGDRTYNADDMSSYYEGIIRDGVLNGYENSLMVTAGDGMAVVVKTGKAYIKGKYLEVKNESQQVEVRQSDTLTNRYTAIVVRLDENGRSCELIAKDGEDVVGDPVYPEIEENELCLAMVYVKKLAETITQSDITDMRGTEKCGWVTGAIEFLDSGTLFAQWTEIFHTWYAGIQKQMDMEYRESVEIQEETGKVTIPEGLNYMAGDVLLVFKNGILLKKNVEYNINMEGTELEMKSKIPLGNEIDFVNIKPKLEAKE